MREHRSLLQPPLGAVLRINGLFLAAAGTGFLAWACWPTSPGWWQAAVISVFLGLFAVTALVQACTLIFKIYSREREIAAVLASARAQHSADLVRGRALRKSRMTDD